MQNLLILEAALKEISSHAGENLECRFDLEDLIKGVGESFIQNHSPHAEKILLNSAKSNRTFIKFPALCALFKAQEAEVLLQFETLQELKKFRDSGDLQDAFIRRCLERKLKAEAALK